MWQAEEQVIAREFGDPGEKGRQAPAGEQDTRDGEIDSRLRAQIFVAKQFTQSQPGPLLRIADHARRLSGSIDAALRTVIKLQDRRLKQERERCRKRRHPGRRCRLRRREWVLGEATQLDAPPLTLPSPP